MLLTAVVFFFFSQRTYGITIGISILQNTLKTRLPTEILAQFPNTSDITYTIIPVIPTLSEPLRTQVEAAFAQSCSYIWYAVVGISGLGLLSILPAKAFPLDQMMEVMEMMWGIVTLPLMTQTADGQIETLSTFRTAGDGLPLHMPSGTSLSSYMSRSEDVEMESVWGDLRSSLRVSSSLNP